MRSIRLNHICGLVIVLALAALVAVDADSARSEQSLPKIRVVATGGTIAGQQKEPGTLGGYEVKTSVSDLIAAIPIAARYADIETEQFSNIPSPNIAPDDWLRLAKRINDLFKERSDLAGIVVTHGTSRLEETAFFLHLTVRSDRPVVLVGAQRPATGISPDGPINLLSAIRVASARESRGKGVTVVMDDRIMSARDVTKLYARNGGFEGAEMGMLGVVTAERVEFFYAPVRKHTVSSDFDVSAITALPRVGISYSYAGAEGIADQDAKAIVVATTNLAPQEDRYYEGLREKGVVVAHTFPSGREVSSAAASSASGAPPMINVKHLMPTKARVLMMLALTRTQLPSEIQKIFDSY
jgi:L-asparaginase